MKKIFKCTRNKVIEPHKYYAKSGEEIEIENKRIVHRDKDGQILYFDDNVQISYQKINNILDFYEAFEYITKNYKIDAYKKDMIELLKYTKNSPVIIGGCGRSGTTLLLAILGAHSQIHALQEETHAFHPKPFRLNRITNLIKNTDMAGKFSWCEKTPKNIMCYDEILSLFNDNVKIINMIRNGKDVVTSIHPNGKGKYWVNNERWIKDNCQYTDHPNIMTVKFEDLVGNTKKTLIGICEHINLTFEPEMLNYHIKTNVTKNIAWEKKATPIGCHNSNKSHKRKEADLKRIKSFMSDRKALQVMKRLGYTTC